MALLLPNHSFLAAQASACGSGIGVLAGKDCVMFPLSADCTVDSLISYLVIWQSDFSAFETAGLIAGFEILTKITLYYIHERIWSSITWGRV